MSKKVPKEAFPEIVVPEIFVSTSYPGNSPVNMEKLITRPLEKEINTISGIDEIPGLSIDWFHVDYEDHIAGQPLGNMASRGLPGVTVVAIVRSDAANPVPAEDFKVLGEYKNALL